MAEQLEFVNEDTPISDGVAHHELEFVNDWSELEAAVILLANQDLLDPGNWYTDVRLSDEAQAAIDAVIKYVPRLLTQYANLVELSFALTEGWEHYASLQGPTGLYLPDHR